jgi:hypothetical protein
MEREMSDRTTARAQVVRRLAQIMVEHGGASSARIEKRLKRLVEAEAQLEEEVMVIMCDREAGRRIRQREASLVGELMTLREEAGL